MLVAVVEGGGAVDVVAVVVVIHSVQANGAAKIHDRFGNVIKERRQLFPVDSTLSVHVVNVEDELRLCVLFGGR